MQTIYCVEDDENIREMVVYALRSSGFEAEGLESGNDLSRALAKRPPALVILDIMLPGEDGIAILKGLRADHRTRDIPVIMLTAKSAEYDKIKGLDAGADDYMTKPFGVLELISRVRAVLRRLGGMRPEGRLQAGAIELDSDSRTVTAEGVQMNLTFKEFELLRCLMNNRGVVLTRDRLMENVWGFDFEGESRTIDMHVKTLRQKLGESGSLIETVRGVGYRIGG